MHSNTTWGCLLAVVAVTGCGESPIDPPNYPDPRGSVRLTVTVTGSVVPSVTVRLDGGADVTVPTNTATNFDELAIGEHAIQVDVPGACTANHFAPQVVEVEENGATPLEWRIRCPAPSAPGVYFVREPSGIEREVWRSNLDGSDPMRVDLPGRPDGPAMNPARTRLAWVQTAIGEGRGNLHISDPDGRNAVNTGWFPNTVAWSPDGRRLLIAGGGVLALVWPDGTTDRTLRPTTVNSADWSPDGNQVVYLEGYYHYVMDLDTGERTNTLNMVRGDPRWSPDGSRIAFVTYDGQARLMSMRPDGTDLRELHRGNLQPQVAWAGSNTILFAEWRDEQGYQFQQSIYKIPAAGGTPTTLFPRFDLAAYLGPHWAP